METVATRRRERAILETDRPIAIRRGILLQKFAILSANWISVLLHPSTGTVLYVRVR